jgi:hypothetical protein
MNTEYKNFPIQRNVLILNFAYNYAMKTVKGNEVRLEVNGKEEFLAPAFDAVLLSGNINTTKRISVTVGC